MSKVKPQLSKQGTVVWREFPVTTVAPSRVRGAFQLMEPDPCGRCERLMRVSEYVFRSTGDTLVGVSCCATEDDTITDTGTRNSFGDQIDESLEAQEYVDLATVMPYGKTKKDMCERCFQIPASNGVCCDW